MERSELRPEARKAFFVAFLSIAMPFSAEAAGLALKTSAAVDAIVRRTLKEDGAPSASVAIVIGGQVAYASAYGLANLNSAESATTSTRYQIASISKTLTADGILRLEQMGKLSIGDKVAKWLPGLTAATQVTLRDLLTHTAGYPDHYPQTYPAGPRVEPTTPDHILAEWGRHKLLFAPGSDFRYSNLNYLILARVIEKVSGQPFFAFLSQHIFARLGMSDTVDLDNLTYRTPNLATGYVRPALGPLEPAPHEGAGWSFGSGQVVTTAKDLAYWDAAFLAGSLLAPAQAAEEVTAPTLPNGTTSEYALGLFVSHRGGRTMFYHVGQGLGFLAVNRIYPAEHAAIVVLTNDSSALTFQHVADRLEYIIVPPTRHDADARAVFASLQRGRPNRTLFKADLNAYFDARMVSIYAKSLGKLGAVVSFTLRSESDADGLTTRAYTVVAGTHRLRLLEQTDVEGRIETFQVQPDLN